jgi:hypothetical protein
LSACCRERRSVDRFGVVLVGRRIEGAVRHHRLDFVRQVDGVVRSVNATGRDMVFICCAKCGGVVGTAEQSGVVNLLLQIARKLGVA